MPFFPFEYLRLTDSIDRHLGLLVVIIIIIIVIDWDHSCSQKMVVISPEWQNPKKAVVEVVHSQVIIRWLSLRRKPHSFHET